MNPQIEQASDLLAINQQLLRAGFLPPATPFFRVHPFGADHGYFRVGVADADNIVVTLLHDTATAHLPQPKADPRDSERRFASIADFRVWATACFG